MTEQKSQPITYWCSSKAHKGKVVTLEGRIYKTPRQWFDWRGKEFTAFVRALRITYEVMHDEAP